MSSMTSGTVAVAILSFAAAETTSAYWPFGSPSGAVNANVCAPAGFWATSSVERVWFDDVTSVTVTLACVVSV